MAPLMAATSFAMKPFTFATAWSVWASGLSSARALPRWRPEPAAEVRRQRLHVFPQPRVLAVSESGTGRANRRP